MNQTLAIIGDTWRQSKQQVVFIIMLVLLGLTVTAGIVLPRTMKDEDGTEGIGFLFTDEPAEFLQMLWYSEYMSAVHMRGQADELGVGEAGDQIDEETKQAIRKQTQNTSPIDKGAQAWTQFVMSFCYSIGLLLFIAACAGYFPDLLAAGAVDVVLSKPISRTRVLLSKYVGGLFLYSAAMVIVAVTLFVGLGLRLGVWNTGLFMALPLSIFSAAVLFALLSLAGIVMRSTALCVVIGYFLYLIVDTGLGVLMQLQVSGMLDEISWLETSAKWARYTLPNFEMLKSGALSHILDVPPLPWAPTLIALAWLVGALALANFVFRRRDF